MTDDGWQYLGGFDPQLLVHIEAAKHDINIIGPYAKL